MKEDEVPKYQSALTKKNMKDLSYATDKEGKYTTALSDGWEPKALALDISLQEIEERVNEAKKNVYEGKVSPLAYYMELRKMDTNILAAYVGIWTPFVKLHFNPFFFKRLSNKTLQKYATAFDISIEELKNFEK